MTYDEMMRQVGQLQNANEQAQLDREAETIHVEFPDGTSRWTTQAQLDYEHAHPPLYAPGYLLSRDEWPMFRCSFQCPATGYGLAVEWNQEGDEIAHVIYAEDTYGQIDLETQQWAKSAMDGKGFGTAADVVDALVAYGCYLDDLL